MCGFVLDGILSHVTCLFIYFVSFSIIIIAFNLKNIVIGWFRAIKLVKPTIIFIEMSVPFQ